MTDTDLSILADAIAFALLVAIGGAALYAVARAALRRASRQVLIAGLPIAALVALALAGTAVWPFARESVKEAVGVHLDDEGHPGGTAGEFEGVELPAPGFEGSNGMGHAARLFKVAWIGTDGGVDPGAPAGEGDDGASSGGSDGDPGEGTGDDDDGGSGGGTDPSPTVEPSPTGGNVRPSGAYSSTVRAGDS